MSSHGLCVIPVAASSARLWVEGRLNDGDLLLRAPLRPECVFIVNLPDRGSYGHMLRLVAYWQGRGAVSLITRTGTPIVARHLLKNGCVRGVTEDTTPAKTRWIAPPDAFSAWVHKFIRNYPA